MSKQNLNLSYCTSSALKLVKNIRELIKLLPLKVKGVKNSKTKPPNATNVGSQTPTKFLICCYVTMICKTSSGVPITLQII